MKTIQFTITAILLLIAVKALGQDACLPVLKVYDKPMQIGKGVEEKHKARLRQYMHNYLVSQQQRWGFRLVSWEEANAVFKPSLEVWGRKKDGSLSCGVKLDLADKVDSLNILEGIAEPVTLRHSADDFLEGIQEGYMKEDDPLMIFAFQGALNVYPAEIPNPIKYKTFAYPKAVVLVDSLEVDSSIIEEVSPYYECLNNWLLQGTKSAAAWHAYNRVGFGKACDTLAVGSPANWPSIDADIDSIPTYYVRVKVRPQGEYYVFDLYDKEGNYLNQQSLMPEPAFRRSMLREGLFYPFIAAEVSGMGLYILNYATIAADGNWPPNRQE